ncbi:lactate racemase domain-containing protein [Planctomicrobium sp. SH661]|uniref:lactate racemase domain-containing protein n=1 Tax=Planctomicrobium sp. SH661 TaxID=3448124 RepID=UPI003F5B8A00
MSEEVIPLQLKYGRSGSFQVELLERQILFHHHAPSSLPDPQQAIEQALEHPLDFPELERAFVPGDRPVVVIDVDTPAADLICLALWKKMDQAGVNPSDLTFLQPAVWKPVDGIDPRRALPEAVREQVTLTRHDPTVSGSCAYLATTAGNERIYLSRLVTDADVVVTIGPAGFDPVLGVRGTSSSLYPGLSELEAIQKIQGQGHEELRPEDARPLRQAVDEIGWLTGLQLSIAVLPSGGTDPHAVIAGQSDSVLRSVRKSLKRIWDVRSEERAELVLVTVPQDGAGHSWDQVAAAANVGRRLVERNGRIVILSQLNTPPGPGLEILKSVREPRDAIQQIRQSQTPDLLAATRIAAATDWANVSLLSQLDPNVVSDLFMLPLENENEVRRLLESEDLTAIIEGAQHVYLQSGI